MRQRIVNILIFLLILLPSAQFAWRNRDMPEFASLHDDGVLFASGKSLAGQNGYRLPSLPENAFQTKAPPLYPLYLSLIWRLNPDFPRNLLLATLLCWLVLALFLALAWMLYRSDGYSETRSWLLTGLLGLSPYIVLFGCTMFSEIFFTSLVLACLSLARRPGNAAIFLAGVAAAAAYLSRTAGIALLLSVPACLLWRREWRRTALFLAPLLPAVIGWSVWSALHKPGSTDLTLMYYTDYLRYEFVNVGWDNLAVVVWKNIDQVLYGMGSLVLPKIIDLPPVKILAQVLAVAMIAGIVRLVRRGVAIDYAIFALVSVGILVVWHFPPNERFVLPLFPLLLAGLFAEVEHLAAMLKPAFRHRDVSQRIVAGMFAAGLASVFLAALGLQCYMTFISLSDTAAGQRRSLADRRAAYRWMAANLPPGANVLSYDDPLLYLYSGHRGNYLPLLTRWWYAEDHASIVNAYRDLPAYCASRHLAYVYFTKEDLSRETGEQDRAAIEELVRSNPALTPVYSAGIGTVYRILP